MGYELKDLQRCQLSILREFASLCEKHRLKFFLAFGSCLGAIRHNGFIPWDDDVDVCMLASDYERLKYYVKELPEHLSFQTYETDEQFPLSIGRIRDSRTTLIEKDTANIDINHGVYIDIYPMFCCNPRPIPHKIAIARALLYRLLIFNNAPKHKGRIVTMGSKLVLSIISEELRKKLIHRYYQKFSRANETGYLSSYYGDELTVIYDEHWFSEQTFVTFEDTQMPVPNGYDNYLKFTYGDYMRLPPEEKRAIHHEFKFVDLETPYIAYRGKEYCCKDIKI